jgi:hypothetical protein
MKLGEGSPDRIDQRLSGRRRLHTARRSADAGRSVTIVRETIGTGQPDMTLRFIIHNENMIELP